MSNNSGAKSFSGATAARLDATANVSVANKSITFASSALLVGTIYLSNDATNQHFEMTPGMAFSYQVPDNSSMDLHDWYGRTDLLMTARLTWILT